MASDRRKTFLEVHRASTTRKALVPATNEKSQPFLSTASGITCDTATPKGPRERTRTKPMLRAARARPRYERTLIQETQSPSQLTSSESPVELLTNENGTYEEVKESIRAAAKEMAMARRQQQTLDQLTSMQLNKSGIIRLRQPLFDAVAELNTEPPGPAELAGSSCEDCPTASVARRSSSVQLFGEESVITTPNKEQPKSSDPRILVPDMPWARNNPVASNRDQLPTAKDLRRKSYVYQPASTSQEPQPGATQYRHSTSILAVTDPRAKNLSNTKYSSDLASPEATSARTSITDATRKENPSYSCFDEFDKLVKELPPRTSRRRLHPEVGSMV
ncbi:MAG: hypothetical protein Q9184_004317 [Pyrenodesmia sp. 2 TL-2023]